MASLNVADDDCNLETLLAKATNPLHREPDPPSILSFCQYIEKEKDGPQTALRLLAHKIQSPLEKESLMALSVLEECVKICGTKFKSEVGKFRFLNEMIKVVSPKYLGNRASPKVKQKIVELLYLWSVELKQETKIFEAYQMLRRQGVVMEDPVYVIKDFEPLPPPAPRPKNAVFDDEEKAKQLQMLLSSNKPEDLQAANKLIKNMVKEADRRMELLAKRSTEIETVNNNANVLSDMLDHYNVSTSAEEKELMKELFESCERLRPKLFRLAGEMDEADEGLCDILKANDGLTLVINRYRKAMGIEDTTNNSQILSEKVTNDGETLLDLASPVQESNPSQTSDSSLLDDQLLVLGLTDPLDMPKSKQDSSLNAGSSVNPLSELDQIFTVGDSVKSSSSLPSSSNNIPLCPSLAPSVVELGAKSQIPSIPSNSSVLKPGASVSKVNNIQQKTANIPLKGLEELDELGQSLLKQSLPGSSVFHAELPNTSQKISLSQLKQQKEQSKPTSTVLPHSNKNDSVKEMPAKSNLISNSSSPERTPTPQSPMHEVVSLINVFVPLESIQPGSMPPLTLFEKNGLTVIIHFGVNCPRPDVSVMVVSIMSKNTSPVENVNFQAAVPKTMKIKLQPPSATDLPPHNPILPPAAITQVMLLANPQKEKVRFKYKVNYNLSGQYYTEVGETEDFGNQQLSE